jgi:RNA polymerase sigma-70 factor (ECF subfamily)
MIEEREQRAASLMQALADGQDAALNRLMADWSGPLIGYLTKLTGSTATGEDLAQETFVRVYRSCKDYRAAQRFSTWLFTIASNLAKNHHRWKKRHPEDSQEPQAMNEIGVATEQADPAESMSRQETMQTLQRAVKQLPEPLRQALLLSVTQGLSYQEIARIQNSSEKAVELRVYRARKQLREWMAGHLSELAF